MLRRHVIRFLPLVTLTLFAQLLALENLSAHTSMKGLTMRPKDIEDRAIAISDNFSDKVRPFKNADICKTFYFKNWSIPEKLLNGCLSEDRPNCSQKSFNDGGYTSIPSLCLSSFVFQIAGVVLRSPIQFNSLLCAHSP